MVDKMEAGEKELRKAFEETTIGNLKKVLEHANETRKLVRDLEEKVHKLEGVIRAQNSTIEALRAQLAGVQTIIFSKGT